MKKIIVLITAIFLSFMSVSCTQVGKSTSTLGDGKIDAVESATIRVAVGLSLSSRPELTLPAYKISTAVLSIIDANKIELTTIPFIDKVIAEETSKLKLDPATLQSFSDLIALVKTKIQEQVNASVPSIPKDNTTVVIIRDVILIIQQSSMARLESSQKTM